MNATQIKYLRQRINERNAEKRLVIMNKYAPTRYSNQDRLDMIADGRATLREKVNNATYGSGYITDYFDFPSDEREVTKKRNEALDKLDKFTKGLMDQVILGDVDEALKMLATFDTFEI